MKLKNWASTPVTKHNESLKRIKNPMHIGANTFPKVPQKDASMYSPLDFDQFVPWVCKQMSGSTAVLIIRKTQEQYTRGGVKKVIGTRSKNSTRVRLATSTVDISPIASTHSAQVLPVIDEPMLPITVYYDLKHRLLEISIVKSPIPVSRKVFQAFGLCISHHASLTRFTFRDSGLTAQLLYEINKLLPISNISELNLDDSNVPAGNYFILLEQLSGLKCLSLNRCHINDEMCIKIFANITIDSVCGQMLKVLELGTNDITDIGAKFIGSVLRANRSLVHLNLSGNKITDSGFRKILEALTEFILEPEEILRMRRRRVTFLRNKTAVYMRCVAELKQSCVAVDDMDSTSSRKVILKRIQQRKKSKKLGVGPSVYDVAEAMARRIVGEFFDPFSVHNVEFKNDLMYSEGNFVLSSINIAYNDLQYPSVFLLNEVLKYQEKIVKPINETGLVRVNIEGNDLPISCAELDHIDFYFKKLIYIKTSSRKYSRAASMASVLKTPQAQKTGA